MLTMRSHFRDRVCIVGLDPGTNTFGIAKLVFSNRTGEIISTEARTLVGERLPGRDLWLAEQHGEMYSRVSAISDELVSLLNDVQPDYVATESPFFNSLRPYAYGTLMTTMTFIRQAVTRYSSWCQLHLLPPSCVKLAVQAGSSAKKDAVREAVLALPDLKYESSANTLDTLDEHSIDAIAVAYGLYKQIGEERCLFQGSLRPTKPKSKRGRG
jgi:Holliday junction resolvasome RuvABC endonuclease subunit